MTQSLEADAFRLFVAIALPEELLPRVQEIQGRLRQAAAGALVRWTTRDQWHLTLKFLGDVASYRCEELRNTLRKTCASFRPIQLTAGGIGFFPSPDAPRVIWLAVADPTGVLAGLQGAIDQAIHHFSSQPMEQRFRAHVTLGRVKSMRPAARAGLGRLASEAETRALGTWTASHVELFRSQLSDQGARYTILESAALAPPPA